MAQFRNIVYWFNTRKKHIPQSRRTHSKSTTPNRVLTLRTKRKSEIDEQGIKMEIFLLPTLVFMQ